MTAKNATIAGRYDSPMEKKKFNLKKFEMMTVPKRKLRKDIGDYTFDDEPNQSIMSSKAASVLEKFHERTSKKRMESIDHKIVTKLEP